MKNLFCFADIKPACTATLTTLTVLHPARLLITVFALFTFALPSYCGCKDWKNGNYPEQLLKEYSRNYLNEYCSAPKNEQTSDIINQYGQYFDIQVKPGDVGYLNSKYDPNTTNYPFVPKADLARADYYFNEGLKMEKARRAKLKQ